MFRPDGQARLLAALMLEGDELSIRDLAGSANFACATAHGEITRLLNAGILRERLVGRSRPINPTILTVAEFDKASGFLESARSGPIVSIIGHVA